MSNTRLSIVVPVYNEAAKIKQDLYSIFQFFESQNYSFEVIVVNDGSTDRTLEEIESFKKENGKLIEVISYAENQGKGFAVKSGMLQARGEIFLLADAGSCVPYHNLEEGFKILAEGYDLAWGARNMKDSVIVVQASYYRRILGNLFRFFIRSLMGLNGLTDTQCGFKLFTHAAAKKLFKNQKINGFSFDVELAVLAKKFGLSLKQFPVHWKNDPDSRVRVGKQLFTILKELFIIFLRKQEELRLENESS